MTRLLIVLCGTLLGGALPAQSPRPVPAPELARFEPLIGHWSGTGTVVTLPGAPPVAWTSRSTWSWVLGGHVAREAMRVEFENDVIPAIVFRTDYAWDRERKCHVSWGLDSMGNVGTSLPSWVNEETLVTVLTRVEGRDPVVERSVLRITGDGHTFALDILEGDGEARTVVRGEQRRSDRPYVFENGGGVLAPDSMARMQSIVGEYSLRGRVMPMPGAEPVELRAREVITPLLGGLALEFRVHFEGPGSEFEWVSYLHWDRALGAYRAFSMDNTGLVGQEEGRWISDREFVMTSADTVMGRPGVQRSVVEVAEDGSLRRAWSDRMDGVGATVRVFEADYEKAETRKL